MNLIIGIFFIFALNLNIVSCKACSLSDSVCKYNNEELTCYGNQSRINEHQSFEEILQSNPKITELRLESPCIVAGDLDRFDSLKTLSIIEYSEEPIELQLFDESIFTPKLGLTLLELSFYGNYSFSNSTFKHLINLTSLGFAFNFQLEPMLTKELFSVSLSNLKNLSITHSRISRFDGDMFINLKSLEDLDIYVNDLKEFPKAIKYIPSLKSLGAAIQENLQILNYPFPEIMRNLEVIDFGFMSSLKSIGSCAFCSFPNLKDIFFGNSTNLTWIHENAFGGLRNDDSPYKVKNLRSFHIEHCNVSVLPEHLLNWSKLKHIYLGDNQFICNCSNAWLIEDIQSKNPVFSDSLKGMLTYGHKSNLLCYGPEHVKGKLLKEISTEGCKEMICKKEPTSKALWFFIGFFIAILLVIITTIIIFRNQVKKFYERTKSNVEHIKLQEYGDS